MSAVSGLETHGATSTGTGNTIASLTASTLTTASASATSGAPTSVSTATVVSTDPLASTAASIGPAAVPVVVTRLVWLVQANNCDVCFNPLQLCD